MYLRPWPYSWGCKLLTSSGLDHSLIRFQEFISSSRPQDSFKTYSSQSQLPNKNNELKQCSNG
eukprot:1159268-Pelagomonas_calceolata.AAC.1